MPSASHRPSGSRAANCDVSQRAVALVGQPDASAMDPERHAAKMPSASAIEFDVKPADSAARWNPSERRAKASTVARFATEWSGRGQNADGRLKEPLSPRSFAAVNAVSVAASCLPTVVASTPLKISHDGSLVRPSRVFRTSIAA